MKITVFDPAMCCSTGVCGPSVDPRLARFSADLDRLKSQGVSIERFNLSAQPEAFVKDDDAKEALESKGEEGLPLIKVNGEVKSSGVYPSLQELASWTGVDIAIESGISSDNPDTSAASGCCQPKGCC